MIPIRGSTLRALLCAAVLTILTALPARAPAALEVPSGSVLEEQLVTLYPAAVVAIERGAAQAMQLESIDFQYARARYADRVVIYAVWQPATGRNFMQILEPRRHDRMLRAYLLPKTKLARLRADLTHANPFGVEACPIRS